MANDRRYLARPISHRVPRTADTLMLLMSGLYAILLLRAAPCAFFRFFHIPCPGCGMRNALCALLRLDFASACRYHPMVFFLPLFPVLILSNGRPTRYRVVNTVILGILLGGFLITYVYRLAAYFAW